MRQVQPLSLLSLCGVVMMASLAPAQEPAPANLLTNGGFEVWIPATSQKNWPETPDGVPSGWQCEECAYEQARDPAFPVQGKIARDADVKHSGQASLRIENGLITDITDVIIPYSLPVRSNTVYRIRLWVRGESIVPAYDGPGAIVWCHVGHRPNPWVGTEWLAKVTSPGTGTFDWTPFELRMETPPDGEMMSVTVQLRRASGKVWYDDIEVAPVGRIVRVEIY